MGLHRICRAIVDWAATPEIVHGPEHELWRLGLRELADLPFGGGRREPSASRAATRRPG
jgi:hypothetical protein